MAAEGTTITTTTTVGGQEFDFFPIEEEVVDFFSTGEGGFLVDPSGNVAFADATPIPGGQGSNACGVVLSCSPNNGRGSNQDNTPPGQVDDEDHVASLQ